MRNNDICIEQGVKYQHRPPLGIRFGISVRFRVRVRVRVSVRVVFEVRVSGGVRQITRHRCRSR